MKHPIRLLSLIAVLWGIGDALQAQNMGINTNTPDNSAILEISSTDKGLLIPRMTTSQRMDIPAPATGLLVYDLTAKTFFVFNDGWKGIGGSELSDADGDTKIEVEKNPDEDVIRLTVGGEESFLIEKNAKGQHLYDMGFETLEQATTRLSERTILLSAMKQVTTMKREMETWHWAIKRCMKITMKVKMLRLAIGPYFQTPPLRTRLRDLAL